MNDMPKGRGRKGGQTPRPRKKKEAIKEIVDLFPIPSSDECELSILGNADTAAVPSCSNAGTSTSPACAAGDSSVHHKTIVSSAGTGECSGIPCTSTYQCPQPPTSQYAWFQSYINQGNQTVQNWSVPTSTPQLPSLRPLSVNIPHQPSVPAPVHTPQQPSQQMIFNIKFISGNVSICYGCRNKYPKKPSPPNDLCLQTVEWRQYFPQGSNFPHSRWSNTYYHPRVICVRHNWPLFDPTLQVKIDSDVRSQLTNVHKNFIICELGLHI